MAQPKVSVLVPVYNGAQYLKECLDSILAQHFHDLEILVSDDRSADDSLEIIKAYAARDSRIRWWQNPHNLGLTENQNVCLREARGNFIKFIHQDDKLLAVSAIQKLATALADNPTATLAGSASDVIDVHSRVKVRRVFFRAGVWDGRQIILSSFEAVANNIGEPSVVMFRRTQAARGFLTDYKQMWDLEMWYHLLEQGKFFYLAESLAAFRQHPGQQSEVNIRNGVSQNEMLTLLECYYAKPWLREIATQRMLINQARFLKKLRPQFGHRADLLLSEIQTQINPASYPVYWLERKALRPFKEIKKLAVKTGHILRG